jgi:hypothetical protein
MIFPKFFHFQLVVYHQIIFQIIFISKFSWWHKKNSLLQVAKFIENLKYLFYPQQNIVTPSAGMIHH